MEHEMSTQYFCKNKKRRDLLVGYTTLNGIDFLEVLDDPDFLDDERQSILAVYFVNPLEGIISPPDSATGLNRENVLIDGGIRTKHIKVPWAYPASLFSPDSSNASQAPNNLVSDKALEIITSLDDPDHVLIVRTNSAGDFSFYTLKLIKSTENPVHPDGFDPILSEVDFSFKVLCPSEFDCKSEEECPPLTYPAPEINYLAKDYASFRRLMLDRLSLLTPGWKERNAADLQVALVELLAYAGDHLSYYQDAVATEAYLETARKRISVRRHARLVDYFMHDGCNARAWIHLRFEGGALTVSEKTKLLTRCSNAGVVVGLDEAAKIIEQQKPEVFETMFPLNLHPAHNEIKFYTWSDNECCLPKGATKATLYENPGLSLKKGDFLLFEEEKSPVTGEPEDRDPSHRQVVRLVDVVPTTDDLYDPPVPVVNIQWHEDDALTLPFCISTVIETGVTLTPVENISIARSNIVLADHGQTITEKETFTPDQIKNRLPAPLRLSEGPITCTEGFNPEAEVSAAYAMRRKLHRCCQVTKLIGDPDGEAIEWDAQKDLLASDQFAREFVVETESDGTAYIRFGDGILGKEPDNEKKYGACYRVGNGTAGNVGAGAIAHIVPQVGGSIAITKVSNPLPAHGGTNPETIEEVRQFAPQAFRIQERAVTEQDYADVAMRYPEIQKAVATFRWTGSWFTVFLVVDRKAGKFVTGDAQFRNDMYEHMEKYRMAGFDLELEDPVYVPLDIALKVCVKSGYFKSDVKEVLLKVFSSYEWGPGRRGFFHPDNLTFAQPVYLSRIYETAAKVEGVASVEVTRFQRWGEEPNNELEKGVLKTGKAEIVRLDNDRNYPENGKIEFNMQGGM